MPFDETDPIWRIISGADDEPKKKKTEPTKPVRVAKPTWDVPAAGVPKPGAVPPPPESSFLKDTANWALTPIRKAQEVTTHAIEKFATTKVGKPIEAAANKTLDALQSTGAATTAAAFNVAENMDEESIGQLAKSTAKAAYKADKNQLLEGIPTTYSGEMAKRCLFTIAQWHEAHSSDSFFAFSWPASLCGACTLWQLVQPTLRLSCWLPAHRAFVLRSWQLVQSSLAS